MVAPVIIGAAIGAGVSLLNGMSEKSKTNKLIKEQRKIIIENFNNDISAMRSQFELNKSNAVYDKYSNELQGKKAIADTTVNAAASGFGGISFNEAIVNIEMQKDFKNRIQQRNLDLMSQNLDAQAFGKFSQMKANIKQAEGQAVTGSDIVMGTIQGGVQGASFGQSFGK